MKQVTPIIDARRTGAHPLRIERLHDGTILSVTAHYPVSELPQLLESREDRTPLWMEFSYPNGALTVLYRFEGIARRLRYIEGGYIEARIEATDAGEKVAADIAADRAEREERLSAVMAGFRAWQAA